MAFIKGSESKRILNNKDLTIKPYNDTTWAMRFNTNSLIFSSKEMRKAFCLGLERLDGDEYNYLSDAKAIMPESCKIGANNAVEAVGTTVHKQNIGDSVNLWKEGLENFGVTDITVTIITTEELENALKETLQGVQSGIGTVVRNEDGDKLTFVIKVKTMTENEMNSAILKGDYDIAFYPYRATSNSAISYLRSVASESGGFDKDKVDKALTQAEKSADLKKKSECIRSAETEIIESYALYPMIYETGYYTEAKSVSGVEFHMGTGRISFVRATRND